MKQWIISSIVAATLGVSGAAVAQQAEVTGGGGAPAAVYESETVMDFDGDDLTGSLLSPADMSMLGIRRGKQSTLINIRTDFMTEMARSVEDM